MADTGDFKNGTFFLFNGKPCQLIYFQHVKPGKGNTIVRTRFKDLETGKILENTYLAGTRIDFITVERRPYQFLYKDDMGYHFMHKETFEQIDLGEDFIENADLMKDGQDVEMMFWADEDKCLTCELPQFVELKITYTEPAVKGNTASTNALKEATLETGAKVMVPLFVNEGDVIRVKTVDRSYGERVR
ncbi:MAG: elongation factor P [Bacteroidales bacterium]|jgi:elongation factor P|nr:elongation factor P [Bacteroidales bacterium]